MSDDLSGVPTREQVEGQLEKMMGSAIFKAKEQAGGLLSLIVIATLDGKEVTEKYIREEMFPTPPYVPESNIARITMVAVKEALDAYYAGEGKDDVVLIKLPQSPPGKRVRFPAGEAYKPRFNFNTRGEIAKLMAEAHRLERSEGLGHGIDEYKRILELDPEHLEAALGLSESFGLIPFSGMSFGYVSEMSIAENMELKARHRDHWRVHASIAVSLLILREVEAAEMRFGEALRKDRRKTEEYSGYQVYLVALGRLNDAIDLARRKIDKKPNDSHAKAMLALFLYMARERQVTKVARDLLKEDPGLWFGKLVAALVQMEYPGQGEAYKHLSRVDTPIIPTAGFPAGLFMATLLKTNDVTGNFLGMAGFHAGERLCEEGGYWWSQCGIWAMASGNVATALVALENARNQYDPIILLMPWLPLFDKLRKFEEFKELERKRFEKPPVTWASPLVEEGVSWKQVIEDWFPTGTAT